MDDVSSHNHPDLQRLRGRYLRGEGYLVGAMRAERGAGEHGAERAAQAQRELLVQHNHRRDPRHDDCEQVLLRMCE